MSKRSPPYLNVPWPHEVGQLVVQARQTHGTATFLHRTRGDYPECLTDGADEKMWWISVVIFRALSIEISLKAIAAVTSSEHRFYKTHCLLSLFHDLEKNLQTDLKNAAREAGLSVDIEEALADQKDHFPEFRYIWEMPDTTANLTRLQIVANICIHKVEELRKLHWPEK